MNPKLWSCRTSAALWGVLFAPLAPSLADARDVAELLPADTLAYVAWAEPYEPGDLELEQLKELAQQTVGADFGELELSGVGELIGLVMLGMQHAGGLALLDITMAAEKPDIQLALFIAAGDASPAMAEALAGFIEGVDSDAEIGTLEVAGVSMRRLAVPDTPLVLFWGVHQDHFVVALGQPAAERIIAGLNGAGGSSLADSAEWKFAREKAGATDGKWRFSGFGNAPPIVAKIRSLVEQSHGPLPPLVDQVIEALGINGVRSKYFHASESEQGMLFRMFVHLEGERKGLLKLWAQEPLTEEDLRIVPKDAYWAQVCNLDLEKLWADARGTIEEIDPNVLPPVEGTLAMASTFLGLSITEHLLPAFGDTWAVFDAPSHGGVLLTGSVLVAEVRDSDAVHAALTRLVDLLKPLLVKTDVNLALRQTTCDDRTIHYVVVGGVPCPLAPAWTFVADRMVFGLFPQTVAAAAKQVDPKTRGESILDHLAVKGALRNVFPDEFQSLGCSDAKYFARLLYPLGLLYSTAGVSVLSVAGVQLDPTIYPTLADTVKEAQYSVGVGSVDKDGIHYARVGSANAGFVAVAVAALIVSILLPSLARARELAKRAVSASNLRGIGQGCYIYANDNEGRFPKSLEVLTEAGMITREMLNSPRDEEDRISYIYISGQSESDDVRNIIAYERIISDEGTCVLFLDGHVNWIKMDEFRRALLKTYQRLGREEEMPAELRP